MNEVNIKLAATWVMLMLVYLLGDVLRIFSGDFVPGEIMGQKMSQGMLMFAALFMLIPVVMIFLSLILKSPVNKWLNVILAALLFLFNAVGLPSYPSLYDKFLIVVGLLINGLTVWQAFQLA